MPRRAAAGEAATPGAEHSSAGAQNEPSSRQYTRGAEHGSQRRVHDRGAGPGSKRATPHGEAAGGAATPGAKHRSAGARNAPTSRWDTREAERGSRRRRGASVRHADPESPAIHPPSVLPTPLAPRCPAGRRTTHTHKRTGCEVQSLAQPIRRTQRCSGRWCRPRQCTRAPRAAAPLGTPSAAPPARRRSAQLAPLGVRACATTNEILASRSS